MPALTDKLIKSLKPKEKKYRQADGNGLYLVVMPNGGKYWYLRFKRNNKSVEMALGAYPSVSLKEAREKAFHQKSELQAVEDPRLVLAKRQLGVAERSAGQGMTFKEVADLHYEHHYGDKAITTKQRAKGFIDNDFASIHDLPIASIDAPLCLAVLKKIEQAGKTNSAHKAKSHLSMIFRYAIAPLNLRSDNPIDHLRGALRPHKGGHFSAITDRVALGRALLQFEQFTGFFVTAQALKLTPYILCRPGMLRTMQWRHLDLDEGIWTVPAEDLKYELHDGWRTWLSTQAIEIIKEVGTYTRGYSEYVFPSNRSPARPLSENTVRMAMRSVGLTNDQATPHGFRATGRTLLAEELEYPFEWIEMELAHVVKDGNGNAYNRTKFRRQRTQMMQHWADFLDGLREQARKDTSQFTPIPLI